MLPATLALIILYPFLLSRHFYYLPSGFEGDEKNSNDLLFYQLLVKVKILSFIKLIYRRLNFDTGVDFLLGTFLIILFE